MINTTRFSILSASIMIASLLLSACGSSPKKETQPDWVDGVSKKYPQGFYLTGRGEGSSQAAAKNQARADLTKSIEVKVDAKSQDLQEFSRSGSDTRASLKIVRDVQTESSLTVKGIEISETWKNPETGQYYALATLHRQPAMERLSDEIKDYDNTTLALVGKAKDEKDLLAKTGYMAKALQAQYKRADTNRILQVIDRTGEGVKSKINIGDMIATLNESAENVKIKTVAQADASLQLEAILAGAISEAGFTNTPEGDFVLEAAVQKHDLGQKNNFIWVRGVVEVRLKDASGGIRGTERWELKESATDQGSADMRFYNQINKKLKSELGGKLIGFAVKG
ncbi:MAG: LPP20 family lipoprotein [Gammaproteobacteria bacterium]|nr:LPP20 family lipoprotein [Gammaproteobacteria bacterium]MDH5692517.1 LPP20 family lipoprotein [Gammaproteobacteria bacterium]